MVVRTNIRETAASGLRRRRTGADDAMPVASTSALRARARELATKATEVTDDWDTDVESSETDTTLVGDDRAYTPFTNKYSYAKGKWREIYSPASPSPLEKKPKLAAAPPLELSYGAEDENGLREIYVPDVPLSAGRLRVQIVTEPRWCRLPSLKQDSLPPLGPPLLRRLPKIPESFDQLMVVIVNSESSIISDDGSRNASDTLQEEVVEVKSGEEVRCCLQCKKDRVQCTEEPRETRSGKSCLVCRATDVKCEWQVAGTKRKASDESDVDEPERIRSTKRSKRR